jgi:hypothetical protein
MIIDNPQCLRQVVLSCGKVYPTEKEAEKLIKDEVITSHLDSYSSHLNHLLHQNKDASAKDLVSGDKQPEISSVLERR